MLARFRENSDNLKNSLQIRETGFGELRPPPASPAELGIFPSGSSRPFVPGFPLSVLHRFSLCGSSLFLSAISGAWSPHPKIPFLADKALAGGCRFVERSHSRRIHDGRLVGVRYCCGVKPSASHSRRRRQPWGRRFVQRFGSSLSATM